LLLTPIFLGIKILHLAYQWRILFFILFASRLLNWTGADWILEKKKRGDDSPKNLLFKYFWAAEIFYIRRI